MERRAVTNVLLAALVLLGGACTGSTVGSAPDAEDASDSTSDLGDLDAGEDSPIDSSSSDSTSDVGPGEAGALLAGTDAYEPSTATLAVGGAQAYEVLAVRSGTVHALSLFLDATNTCTRLVMGLYEDASGHPGTLIAKGAVDVTDPGWTTVAATTTGSTVDKHAYWIAMLCPTGAAGVLHFRDDGVGPYPSEHEVRTDLADLPGTWSTGTIHSVDGPASAYASE